MIGELSDDLIMTADEIDVNNLFTGDNGQEEIQETPPETKGESSENNEQTTEVVDINPDDLFTQPESVGSGKDNQEAEEDANTDKVDSTSPQDNFYSSIANALKVDGIFPDLDENTLKSIKSPEDFAKAVEQTVQSRLDDRQRRVNEALQVNVDPNDIRVYETTLSNLDTIKEEMLTDESDQGENLRQNLIYQDFRNRGYSDERAKREIQKSFDAGTDIEDAKYALASNKEFFDNQYQSLIKEAQEKQKAYETKLEEQANNLKKSMLEDKEIFEGVSLDKKMRQQAFDNLTKPIHQTEEGEYLTAIQKYERDNPVDFRKYLSVLFTMTDGFKNIDGVVKGKVKKEVKHSLRELEHKLSNTSRMTSGNPTLVGGRDDDPESYIGKGWSLDV